MWILIIAVFSNTGTSITSVPNFTSLQTCTSAGVLVQRNFRGNAGAQIHYQCVKK